MKTRFHLLTATMAFVIASVTFIVWTTSVSAQDSSGRKFQDGRVIITFRSLETILAMPRN